jgi:hypothetical protein
MSYLPAFLARLGLETTADERAIRRAYARLLKQIDQETEAARFQCLREDYEHALAWLAGRSAHQPAPDHAQERARTQPQQHGTAPDLAPASQAALGAYAPGPVHRPAPNPVPAPRRTRRDAPALGSASASASATPIEFVEQIDPDALAHAVYQLFLAALPRLRQGRARADETLWADQLRVCLADTRLYNLAATTAFEGRIAFFLAGARQPGHDTLFNAAVGVFGWIADRQRLRLFGYAGATLNRAIDEQHMFHAQEMAERRIQQQALGALHAPEVPPPGQLHSLMPHLETMMARFPVFMKLLVDQGAVTRWRQAFAQLPPGAAGTAPAMAPQATYQVDHDAGSFPGFLWVMLIIVVGGMLRAISAPGTPPAYSAPLPIEAERALPFSYKPPAERSYSPLLDQMNAPAGQSAPAPQRRGGVQGSGQPALAAPAR